jgi:hypothetical protein
VIRSNKSTFKNTTLADAVKTKQSDRYGGRKSGATYALPEEGKVSAACKRGNHSNCWMLACTCKICNHSRAGK